MNGRSLNRRVTIQSRTISQDAEGVPTETWANLATVWAAVEPISGREYFQAATVQSEVTARIRIRYRSGIVSNMRVLYGSRVFEIVSVIDYQEEHRELQLMCKEVVPVGS